MSDFEKLDALGEIVASLRERDMRIFLGPRPGKKSKGVLADLNLTHCCTLLSEREDARSVSKICQILDCKWVWLPIDGGRLDILRQTNISDHLRVLLHEIGTEARPRIYFHCSAGIHRTGFFVYVLLRLRGLSRDQAITELAQLRSVTAEQVGEHRLRLADELVDNFTCQ